MSTPINLVVIMADQFRAMAIGAVGGDPVSTPTLDRLVASGCYVPNAVSNYPVCSPHRAMFLTSRRPRENGVTLNVNSERAADGIGLRDGLATWASVLRDEGYRTGYIGKWHLEPPVDEDEEYGEGRRADGVVWDAWSPPDRRFGFDFWHSYGAADRHLSPHYWVGDAARHERLDVERWSAEHETDVAIEFIAEAVERRTPFALMLSLNPPHAPYDQVPERYRPAYVDLTEAELLTRPNVELGTPVAAEAARIARDYFAAVTGVDQQLGRIVDALVDTGVERETVVVFTSDHGMQLGSHGLIDKNVPYEESMQVPFVVYGPGNISPHISHELVCTLDMAPTLLGLTGNGAAIPAEMTGTDRSGTLTGQGAESQDPAAVYYRFPSRANPSEVRGLRTRRAKFIAQWVPDTGLEIEYFDLQNDPYELRSDPHGPKARAMASQLLRQLESEGDDWSGAVALRERFAAVTPR